MNTIKIYLTESGRIADLQKDFPLYQGQFQNKLLNVFVPTSILAPMFTSSGAVSADYVASTSTKIGMTYTARDGSIKVSKNYYMRYLKTLMYKGVEYALYERKLPKEFTFYAGQGENSPVLIINVVNIEQQSGDTPPLVLSVITSQTCHLDVMQSTFLDRDELDEPSELENLNAQVQALNALMPKKQDKEDENIALEQAPAEKTVVGAINKLGGLVKTAQSSADTAQQTAETAQTTADNATTLANNAVATANGAVATANEAKTTAQTAENNANSAVDKANDAVGKANEAIMKADAKATSIGFMTAKDAVTALNGYPRTQLKGGDTIWIVEDGTPDLWVTEVAQESVPYNYTTKDKFNQDLVDNKVLQIGYFKTAYQESDGKPVTIAWQNVLVKSTDWVASTEFADFPYEAKIELTDFVDYTTVPQVVFDIADTMSGNYAPICKSGDKCVYIYGKTQNEITLKTVITFAPNVNGASVTGGGYNNRGKWVASTTYAIDDLVYTDNGQFVCIEGITSTTSPEQDTTHWQATFVATGKTKNALKFSGQNTDGSAVQKTFDGSTAVEIAFDEQTMTAKEVDGVLKVGAKGTVPEALPQEASALKSGSLPTTGWTAEIAIIVTTTAYLSSGQMTIIAHIDANIAKLKTGWEITLTGNNQFSGTYYNQYSSGQKRIVYNYAITGGKTYTMTDEYGNARFHLEIYDNGEIKMSADDRNSEGTYGISIKNTTYSQWSYSISDTSITANSDILMELTDDGGVKAYSMEAGKITVIRDTVPTQAIPYTYKVKQTNTSGQFTVLNHFAGVTSVNGQTGAVTIAVPTKTSELENDSGYVSNLPTVQNVVCNDVDSAATLDTTITCEVGDLILAQIIVRSALTLPTGWTLLRTIPAVETTNNQTLSFAYKKATSTSETLTVTQATAGRIYTNLVRLSDAVSISYIQSCEKTGTGITSISSTKPVTANMVIWGVSSVTWNNSSPYGDWTYSPSTLDYYSLQQSTRAPRLGTFIDSSEAGERTFTKAGNSSSLSIMCGAVEIVGDEVARKGDIPTSLPVTYKKVSGSLPTSGWGDLAAPLLVSGEKTIGSDFVDIGNIGENNAALQSGWKVTVTGTINNTYIQGASQSSPNIDIISNTGYFSLALFSNYNQDFGIRIYTDGRVRIFAKQTGNYNITIYNTNNVSKTYTISDTSITANTSVKMYLTDEGGVKAQSKAVGSIQVIRDTVPTTAIPYEYEVEQTSAEGLFEVINAYVPAVPTKTSELTNDSGFITAADIPSAGEWVTVTGETATLTQAGTYQVIASVNDMQSIVYWDGSTAAYGTKSTAPSVSTSGGTAYLFINCAYPQIDASGTLTVHLLTAGNSSGAWTETNTTVSGFKYRKIN